MKKPLHSRREVLGAVAAGAFLGAGGAPASAQKEGLAELPGTHLWYWDTGGSGEPVIFLHPASSSAHVWKYQQLAFAAAGYRAIGYSRRGYRGSDPVPKENPGTAAGDLHALAAFLGVGKFHCVGSAGGGRFGIHYALLHPDRLHSLVLADAVGGVEDADFTAMVARITPKNSDDMPRDFRELGPSYRAANPEGTAEWNVLQKSAITGDREGQIAPMAITWAALERMKVPTLVMGGSADLSAPPPVMRLYAQHIPGAETVTVPEAGHSVYWEQPELFNRTVLTFLGKHRS